MLRAVLLIVVTSTSAARADGSLTVLAGPGIGRASSKMDNSTSSTLLAMRLDVGWSVKPSMSLGVHLAAATSSSQSDVQGQPPLQSGATYTYRPADFGASVLFGRRVIFGAWLGAQVGWQRHECSYTFDGKKCGGYAQQFRGPSPAFGVLLGFDVMSSGPHHLTLTADLSVAPEADKYDRYFTYSAFTAGVAYRAIWTP